LDLKKAPKLDHWSITGGSQVGSQVGLKIVGGTTRWTRGWSQRKSRSWSWKWTTGECAGWSRSWPKVDPRAGRKERPSRRRSQSRLQEEEVGLLLLQSSSLLHDTKSRLERCLHFSNRSLCSGWMSSSQVAKIQSEFLVFAAGQFSQSSAPKVPCCRAAVVSPLDDQQIHYMFLQ
jgi:hypothetical protein